MKKLLVTLLAASMCLSLLAGCGSDEETTTTDETTTSEATTSDDKEDEASDEDSDVAGDVELKEFTILGDHAVNATYYEISEFNDFYAVTALQEIMAKYGLHLDIELVADDQYLTTLQTRFAAMNDIPMYTAMYGMTEAEVMQLAAQGVIIDINPLLEAGDGTAKAFFSENPFGSAAYRKVCTPDGFMYWLPNLYITKYGDTLGETGTNYTVGIRQDWLNTYGLEMPDTLDEFTNALKTFNENDPSGAGNANVAGMHVYSANPCSFGDSMGQWFGLVRSLIGNNWDTGEAVSPWHQATIKDYMQYMRDLNEAGLYDSEMVGSTSTLSQKYANNYVGAMNVYAIGTTYEPQIASAFNPDDTENPVLYQPMVPIQAVEGVQPLLALEDPVYIWDEFCFTSNLTDQAMGAAFLDAYYSQEHIDLINYGVEGVHHELVDGEVKWIQYTATEDGKLFDPDLLNQYLPDKGAQKLYYGKLLYSRTITADMTYYELDKAAEGCVTMGWAASKYDYQNETVDYGHWTSIDNTGCWATANPADVEEINLVWNDLTAYSEQAVSALVLGQKSIDEIDSIVAELDALSLSTVEEIRQGQYDRFLGK